MSVSTSHLTGPGPDEIPTQVYRAVPTPPNGPPAMPPAGPPPSGKQPFLRRRWVKVTGAVVGGFFVIGMIAAAAGGSHPAANAAPAPKATHSALAKPAHHPAASPAAASAVPAGYATDILNAGITAPASWINATGQKIVADWRAGDTTAWTDANVLTPGGVYAYHLAIFDQITARDFGVTPPTQGTQPAAPTAPAAPAPSAPAIAPAQAPATQAPPAPAGPTVSQQQALDSAQSYLADGQGFSRAGLIAQLDSQYGGQFSVADATWAVDHSGADWDAQAVMSAQGYMKMGGFSRASLIDQLTSPYGGQFTLDQATYAANQVGL
jgi:hypothetical protein